MQKGSDSVCMLRVCLPLPLQDFPSLKPDAVSLWPERLGSIHLEAVGCEGDMGEALLLSALATRDRDHSRYVEQQPRPGRVLTIGTFLSYSVGIDVQLCPHREKACLVDEDSHSSAGTLPGPGASLPSSSGPGLTSPPYTATPIDHDYVKCKKPHQQAAPDGIVPVLPTVPRAAHQLWGGCLSDFICRFVLARGVLGLG